MRAACDAAFNVLSLEFPQDYLNLGKSGQRSQIDGLVRRSGDGSAKILNDSEVIVRTQQFAEALQIKPFHGRCLLEDSVIKIQPVDVDNDARFGLGRGWGNDHKKRAII